MSISNKVIGRVLSVDNFRVYIKIEEDLRGAYTSGVNDIYEIARINSYLIIPVGSDRVVALISRVTMKEEFEFDKNTTNITLPTSARYISATMLGTIAKEGEDERFIQGVYNFPTLDNPVWYVTEKDLVHIFDDKQNTKELKHENDFYLPIGTSPAFSNYNVKICPDQFFVKHAAVLGNTGSGKSCTIASIIRSLFRYDYNGNKLENAHFVIFDTNGEYKDAFLPEKEVLLDEQNKKELDLINAYYYGGDEKIQVPYWFMNWEDVKHLFKPSEGAQAPVLNRAIGLAKNNTEAAKPHIYSRIIIQKFVDLVNHIQNSGSDYWKIKNYKDSIDDLKGKNIILNDGTIVSAVLSEIYINGEKDFKIPTASELEPVLAKLESIIITMEAENQKVTLISEQNIDMPIWFNYKELCTKFIDAAIAQESTGNNRIAEFVSTLRLRMNSFLNDKRIAIPLMLKDNNILNIDILAHFIAFILGDFNRFYAKGKKCSFIKNYNDSALHIDKKNRTNQITIVDVSQLPFEVLETVTALLGRLIIEFVSHFLPEQRGKFPIVIVLEEAQNYM
ncbi:MAG: helicase HerA domain-containing protein, partial [Ignavibacteria bacterium]